MTDKETINPSSDALGENKKLPKYQVWRKSEYRCQMCDSVSRFEYTDESFTAPQTCPDCKRRALELVSDELVPPHLDLQILFADYLERFQVEKFAEYLQQDKFELFVKEKALTVEDSQSFVLAITVFLSQILTHKARVPDALLGFFGRYDMVWLLKRVDVRLPKTTTRKDNTIFRRVADLILEWLAEHDAKVYYLLDKDILYLYNKSTGIYHMDAEGVFEILMTFVAQPIGSHVREEAIKILKGMRAVTSFDFEQSKLRFIGFQNGVIDLLDWQFKPHAPENYLLTVVPVNYDPNADCPNFKKYLEDVVDEQTGKQLVEWLGYVLYDGYEVQKALILQGEGQNGKSTFIRAVVKMLGQENVSAVSLQEISENRYALAELYGKKANLYADLPRGALKGTDLFKALTGGDYLMCERKYHDPFKMLNTAKLIFSCNTIPSSPDLTNAYFRRWSIATFSRVFDGKKDDKGMLQKITSPEELSGMVNLGLDGLKRLRAQGDFSNALGVEETRSTYLRLSDSVAAFVQECTEPSGDAAPLSKPDILSIYRKYCRQFNLTAVSEAFFFRHFPELIHVFERQITRDGKRMRAWLGVSLVAPWSNAAQDEQENMIDSETARAAQDILPTKGEIQTRITTDDNLGAQPAQDEQDFLYSKRYDKENSHITHRIEENPALGVQPVQLPDHAAQDEQAISIIFLKNISQWVGADNQFYGPFVSGQLVTLPAAESDFLCQGGLAKRAPTSNGGGHP